MRLKNNLKSREDTSISFDVTSKLMNVNNNSNLSYLNLDDLVKAPDDWNFYGQLNAAKMIELIESIKEIGLQNAIVVWERPNNKYMILSGHNRVAAYKILRNKEDFEKYSKIPAIVKKNNEITDVIAEQIIIDTNWVQRELSPMQKSKSIMRKYINLRKTYSNRNGNLNKVIAEEYNISERALITYKSLNKLIIEYQSLIENSKLTIKAGLAISKYSEDIQRYIYNNYECKTVNKKFKNLKKDFNIEQINKILSEESIKKVITITIDKKYEIEFLKDLKELQNKYVLNYSIEQQ